jgi:hypothetical protein
MITTLHKAETEIVHRQRRDGGDNIQNTHCIVDYNKNTGSVDKVDQMLEPYSFVCKTLKWYRKLVLIQVASLNVYIVHCIDHPD